MPLLDAPSLEAGLAGDEDGKHPLGSCLPGVDGIRAWQTADVVGGRYVRDIKYYPVAPQGDGPTDILFPKRKPGLVHEVAVGRVLALQRNSYAGAVHRATGDFDALSVSRSTMGICVSKKCHMEAVDVVGGREFLHNKSLSGTPVLTMKTPEGNSSLFWMKDSAVLSLGYRAFTNPSWLGATHLWNISATVHHFGLTSSRQVLPEELVDTSWSTTNMSSAVLDQSAATHTQADAIGGPVGRGPAAP